MDCGGSCPDSQRGGWWPHGRRSPVSQPVREGEINGAQWKRGGDGVTAPPIDYWNMSWFSFTWLQYRYGCKCVTRPHCARVRVSCCVVNASRIAINKTSTSNFLSVLEWVDAPSTPLIPTGVPFGPLTVTEHKATTPPAPPTLTTPQSEPCTPASLPAHRGPCRTLRHLLAPPHTPRPPGLSVYVTRCK